MRIMARPLEYLFGSTLGFMKKIKNWQFNPPADEEDEWPTEPRFKPMLYSTIISDNHDNETRPQCTKMKAVYEAKGG